MTPEQELKLLILAAQRTGSRILAAALKPLSLTAAQLEVLQVLADHGPLTLGALGELLVCETGSPSRLVSGLVDRGLVQRLVDPADRRALELSLTEAGAANLRQAAGVDPAIGDTIGQALSPAEVATLIEGLRKLVVGSPAGDAVARRRGR